MEDILDIREAVVADNPLLATIIRSAFKEFDAPTCGTVYSDPTTDNLFQLFTAQNAVLFVAELNGEVVGCSGIYPTEGLEEGCAELVKLYISKEVRGFGIGKQLMIQCFRAAIDFGYKKIYLESLPNFSKAISMYEKSGFVKLNHPMGNTGHTGCNIWMLKEL